MGFGGGGSPPYYRESSAHGPPLFTQAFSFRGTEQRKLAVLFIATYILGQCVEFLILLSASIFPLLEIVNEDGAVV